jgi:uncharacterized protein YbjT (DUF2867 family)
VKNILITGATGNIGIEVIKALQNVNNSFKINAGVRDLEADKQKLIDYKVNYIKFDFTDEKTYKLGLENCDILFLLRPPQISDVKKYFKPLIAIAKDIGIKHIVFLSVQGVEKSSIIPHYKIEKLIVESRIPYTFLRPAYFMQNFTGTLQKDLATKNLIYLPAGNAKFTLIDARDIGAVVARVLIETEKHLNKSYELTGSEKLTFFDMAQQLSDGLQMNIEYVSPNLLSFYFAKKREGIPTALIFVMMMLHYLPQFQKEPLITNWVEEITGNGPILFEQFIADNKNALLNNKNGLHNTIKNRKHE